MIEGDEVCLPIVCVDPDTATGALADAGVEGVPSPACPALSASVSGSRAAELSASENEGCCCNLGVAAAVRLFLLKAAANEDDFRLLG